MTAAERAKQVLDELERKRAEKAKTAADKIDAAKRRFTALQFKEDTREFVLIGKYLLSDAANHPMIEAALQKAEISEHDAAFLQKRGWKI